MVYDRRVAWLLRDIKICLLSTASRPALEPTQSPIQWVPGMISVRETRPGREADQSPSSSVEVKNGGAIPPLLLIISWSGT
jgi:hypothetical protein